MTTKLLNKPCSICLLSLKPPITGFFLPPPDINFVYQKLLEVGMEDEAVCYIELNRENFNGYCTNCWVTYYTGLAMLDPETSDSDKVSIINSRIADTIDIVGASQFWDAVGNPELN